MEEKKRKPKWLETVESLVVALLVAFAIRSFVVEPFKIPSTSLVPTLLVGDHIFVNKFVYGLRIPFTKHRIWDGRDPKRGEVIVFISPEDESKNFIKRVVGLPGDHVKVKGRDLYINGALVSKKEVTLAPEVADSKYLDIPDGKPYSYLTRFQGWDQFDFFQEHLGEVDHVDQYSKFAWRKDFEATVSEDQYFVMGDNRDFSSDSREWGFVPRENIKGRAMFIWLSLNNEEFGIRIHRFGRWIY